MPRSTLLVALATVLVVVNALVPIFGSLLLVAVSLGKFCLPLVVIIGLLETYRVAKRPDHPDALPLGPRQRQAVIIGAAVAFAACFPLQPTAQRMAYPKDYEALDQALAMHSEGRLADALRSLERIKRNSPPHAEAVRLRPIYMRDAARVAVERFRAGDIEGAYPLIRWLESAPRTAGIDPDEFQRMRIAAREVWVRREYETYFELARDDERNGRWSQAHGNLRMIKGEFAESEEVRLAKARIEERALEAATALAEEGRHAESMRMLRHIPFVDPAREARAHKLREQAKAAGIPP